MAANAGANRTGNNKQASFIGSFSLVKFRRRGEKRLLAWYKGAIIDRMRRLLLIVFLAATALTAKDLTKIKVVVTNERGRPVDRAAVIVRFEGRSAAKLGKKVRTSWEMRSGQDGGVELPELPKGTILVQVIAKGYQTYGKRFDVDQDERTIEVTVADPQKQFSVHQ